MITTRLSAMLTLTLLACVAPALPAAVSCTGECTTIEYRKNIDEDATDVTYERDNSGFWSTRFTLVSYLPNNPSFDESNGGGTPYPEETALVAAMQLAAETAKAVTRERINQRYAEKTSDAGTTNTCSVGCECAEGSFVETPDSLFGVIAEIHDYTREENGGTFGYFAEWSGSSTIVFTKRTKTVGCIALEP